MEFGRSIFWCTSIADEFLPYTKEFRRALKPAGAVIIHLGSIGGGQGEWPDNMTAVMAHDFSRQRRS
jgi:hypothetical protein